LLIQNEESLAYVRDRSGTHSFVSQVAVLWNPDNTPRSVADEMQRAGPPLGVQAQLMGVRSPGELEGVFTAATRNRAGALFVVVEEAILLPHRARLLALAAKHRLPTAAQYQEFTEAGGFELLLENDRASGSFATSISTLCHRWRASSYWRSTASPRASTRMRSAATPPRKPSTTA